MWWIIGAIVCTGVALLAGAIIREGNPWGDHHEDDYMMGDDDTDWGDKR
jgi:hypothetical protein